MKPTRIILHHSLTEDGATVSWGAIRKWHMGQHPESPYCDKPMREIGYHFGIELIGDRHEILFGRMPDVVGAHTIGQNSVAIGICLMGNFDLALPAPAQWEVAIKLVRWLLANFRLPPAAVFGHRDFHPKSCPGKFFELEKFREQLS